MFDRVTSQYWIGWRLFRSHARAFVISVLLLFVFWALLEIAVVSLYRPGFAVWLLLHLAWLFLFAGMIVGLHVMALKSVDGGIPRLADLFGSFALGPAYLVAVGFWILAFTAGLALLVVPGIYLGARYSLFAQIIADKSAGAVVALKEAAMLARGNILRLAALFLIALLLNVMGAAMLGIGLTVSFPWSLLTIASFYRSLPPASV
jgi:hypothetical protein